MVAVLAGRRLESSVNFAHGPDNYSVSHCLSCRCAAERSRILSHALVPISGRIIITVITLFAAGDLRLLNCWSGGQVEMVGWLVMVRPVAALRVLLRLMTNVSTVKMYDYI